MVWGFFMLKKNKIRKKRAYIRKLEKRGIGTGGGSIGNR